MEIGVLCFQGFLIFRVWSWFFQEKEVDGVLEEYSVVGGVCLVDFYCQSVIFRVLRLKVQSFDL